MTAHDYMSRILSAAGTKLIDGNPLYSGREGHLRLAREIGAALRDFSAKEQETIRSSSYSVIYVRSCYLQPILDARDWIAEIDKGALCWAN
jgi:hypothetical protein